MPTTGPLEPRDNSKSNPFVPARRKGDEKKPAMERVLPGTIPHTDVLPPQDNIVRRNDDDPQEWPIIFGRRHAVEPRCKACTIIRRLMSRDEYPLPYEQAVWAEYDMYWLLFHDYPANEILGYLKKIYGFECTYDRFLYHVNNHLASPALLKLQRFNRAADNILDIDFFKRALRLPYMTIDAVIDGLMSGELKPTIAEGQKALEFIKSLHELREREEEREQFMEAFNRAVNKTLKSAGSSDPGLKEQLIYNLLEEIRKFKGQKEII